MMESIPIILIKMFGALYLKIVKMKVEYEQEN